jgi:hypothetical protein
MIIMWISRYGDPMLALGFIYGRIYSGKLGGKKSFAESFVKIGMGWNWAS